MNRRSYEAHVLLVPLGTDAARAQEDMVARGLDGVMTVRGVTPLTGSDGAEPRLGSAPLATTGWRPAADGLTVARLVDDADMVVLLATDLAEVPPRFCLTVAEAAQANGSLVAALVVGSGNWDTPQGNTAMAALREAVDMLVVVRGVALAAPFLDVLRGGRRKPALATL
ncbi:hypothetical protein HC028_25050 [Planosporangium flavigriseum]|uniref:Uncharacterized protein n=1 Tax=Planosporangium flavigriseum TaxID=373681 RepID=A0A8J3LYV6_9ACTN|nr:hypothetical protein [Planosporangium flavigriseum]NJC67749.1 hypothetical protein [Planosporangium flavigriseum]GIG76026.1 hypothetical protein Pfl04_44300 [Planosporangium flavigriseum]